MIQAKVINLISENVRQKCMIKWSEVQVLDKWVNTSTMYFICLLLNLTSLSTGYICSKIIIVFSLSRINSEVILKCVVNFVSMWFGV